MNKAPSVTETPVPRENYVLTSASPQAGRSSTASPACRRVPYASQQHQQQVGLHPVLESVEHVVKNTDLRNMQLPEPMSTDDFTRAVAVATVSALRHQQTHAHSPIRVRSAVEHENPGAGGHGGHDAPSWSRTTSASVLLACTALYAAIAGMCPGLFFWEYIYIYSYRGTCGCRRCYIKRLRYRRKVFGNHFVCTGTQHDGVYECNFVCS